jgi:hypothetical protein
MIVQIELDWWWKFCFPLESNKTSHCEAGYLNHFVFNDNTTKKDTVILAKFLALS